MKSLILLKKSWSVEIIEIKLEEKDKKIQNY